MSAMWAAVLCMVVVAVAGNEDAVPHPTCPSVEVVNNFNVSAYMGRWYEIQRYPAEFEPSGACVIATYTQLEGQPPIKLVNRKINDDTHLASHTEGTARLEDDSGHAKLLMQYPNPSIEVPYWVLDTDYTSYSVVYACRVHNHHLLEYSWVLSREPALSTSGREKTNAALDKNGLDKSKYLAATRQDDTCVYE